MTKDSSQHYVAEDNVFTSAFTSIDSPEEKLAIVDLADTRFIPTSELDAQYPDEFI